MKVFGVDPGRSGGYALLIDGELAAHGELCIHPDKLDHDTLARHANDLNAFAFERNHSMPAITFGRAHALRAMGGAKTNWLRGFGNGFLTGWAIGWDIDRLITPTPKQWQKVMLDGVPGDTWKHKSLTAARAFYPQAVLKTKGGRVLDGVADAINIATYAQRILQSEGMR